MHPRYAVIITLLVLTFAPISAIVPAADGSPDPQDTFDVDGPMLYLKAGVFDPVNDPAPGP